MGPEPVRGSKEPGDQGAEGVALSEAIELVVELELFKDILDVGGVAVQVCLEIRAERLL